PAMGRERPDRRRRVPGARAAVRQSAGPTLPEELLHMTKPGDHHLRLRSRDQDLRALALWKDYTVEFVRDSSPVDDDRLEYLFDRGFTPEKWDLYRFDENDPELYLSDWQRSLTRFMNGPYDVVFNNKILFTQVFSGLVKLARTV